MRVGGFFVTGTDTEVGKTYVTAALAAALRARGLSPLAAKPAESGGGDDAARIARAAGHAPICCYRYVAPVAPGVAAEAAEEPIDFAVIAAALAEATLRLRPHLLLVEGAGGLLCPLGGLRTMADLAAHLALPLLIVARSGLGTINHTLLTVAEARRRGLGVAGVILNQISPQRTPDEARNGEIIARLAEVPLLGTVAHAAATLPAALLELAAQAVSR